MSIYTGRVRTVEQRAELQDQLRDIAVNEWHLSDVVDCPMCSWSVTALRSRQEADTTLDSHIERWHPTREPDLAERRAGQQ